MSIILTTFAALTLAGMQPPPPPPPGPDTPDPGEYPSPWERTMEWYWEQEMLEQTGEFHDCEWSDPDENGISQLECNPISGGGGDGDGDGG